MSDITPFAGPRQTSSAAMIVLYRFTRGGGRSVEIRERKVAQWQALEYLVFLDGHLVESQMFHGSRVAEYPAALAARVKDYQDDGWQEEPQTKAGY